VELCPKVAEIGHFPESNPLLPFYLLLAPPLNEQDANLGNKTCPSITFSI